jgi:hypothetical protein
LPFFFRKLKSPVKTRNPVDTNLPVVIIHGY